MTRAQRRWHRIAWVILVPVLVAVLAWALSGPGLEFAPASFGTGGQ